MEVIFVTIVLGATLILAFFISKIFNSKAKDTEAGNTATEDGMVVNDNITEKKSKHDNKPRKKIVDKKPKEKVFQHPWLVSTLKGHSAPVLGWLSLTF